MELLAPKDRFTGTFRHALDAKNRVTVPSRWRYEGLDVLFAMVDKDAGVIKLLPRDELERTGLNVLASKSLSPEKAREFRRVLYARAEECPVDSQGRVLLPAEAIEKLGFGREVMLVGVGERIEVWSPTVWEVAEDEQTALFNKIAKEIGF